MNFNSLAKRFKELCNSRGDIINEDWEVIQHGLQDEAFLTTLLSDSKMLGFNCSDLLDKFAKQAIREMERNRVVTVARKFSGHALEAFKTLLWHFIKSDGNIDTGSILDYIVKLLRYSCLAIQRCSDDSVAVLRRNSAAEVVMLLAFFVEKKSILMAKSHHYRETWTNCAQLCLHYIDARDSYQTLRVCSWILLQIARFARYCCLVSFVEEMVEKIVKLVKRYILSRQMASKTNMLTDELYVNFLRILNELLAEFGAKYWNFICLNFSELCDLVGQTWTDTISCLKPRKFADDLLLSWSEQSKFIDNIFMMYHPDCTYSSLPLSNKFKTLLQLLLDAAVTFMNSQSEFHQKVYRMQQMQLLPDDVVNLLARLFTLIALENVNKNTFLDNSLCVLVTEKDEQRYQILERIFERWSHRLPIQLKRELFVKIFQLPVSSRKGRMFMWYFRAVISGAEPSVIELLEIEQCKTLWKFSLSMLQTRNASNFAASLLFKILIPCARKLQLNDCDLTKLIWSIVNRLNLCTVEIANLLAHVLSSFEFDEHYQTFQHVNENELKIGWTFRSSILKFILEASTHETNVPINAVLEILCYKPNFKGETSIRDVSKVERSLMDLFAIELPEELPHYPNFKKSYIPELIEFVGSCLIELWENVKLEGVNMDCEPSQQREISLFFTLQNLFRCLYTNGANCVPLLKVMQVMSKDLPRIIHTEICNGVDEWISALGGESSWRSADKELKTTIFLALREETLKHSAEFANQIANEEDWNKQQVDRIDKLSQIVSNHVSEVVDKCGSFCEAAFTVERFLRNGTVLEKRNFIAILRSFASTLSRDKKYESEKSINELITADLILMYFPRDEWTNHGLLFNHLSTLHKALYCSIWLDQTEIAKFAMSVDLPDEFRANIIIKIYIPSLMCKIHLRVLAFLISVGKASLYKQLLRIFPGFDLIINLFLEAAATCYAIESDPVDGFLPKDQVKRYDIIRRASANLQSFQHYADAKQINMLHTTYLDILFLAQERILRELFDKPDFRKSFAAVMMTNMSYYFVKLRNLLQSSRRFGYEMLVLRAQKNLLRCDLSACDLQMKLFIIENCSTISALAVRSCLAHPCAENIRCLLNIWFVVYDQLLELQYDLAIEKTYCVLDAFMENKYCTEQILERISPKISESDHFMIEQLFTESSGHLSVLLCKTYWQWLYENFNKLHVKDLPSALARILKIWSRYPVLRNVLAPCLTRFQTSCMGSYYHIFPMGVALQEVIAKTLLELFFDPFELYPNEVYCYICHILSQSSFVRYTNKSFNSTEKLTVSESNLEKLWEADDTTEHFLLFYIEQFIVVLDPSYASILLKIANCVKSFAFTLFPYLFEAAYKTGYEMLQFCANVNHLLTNFPKKLLGKEFPLVVCIVACIRGTGLNLASEQSFKKLPLDLLKLSKICLEANLLEDANYLLHCYLDRMSSLVRPFMHIHNGNRGFFEMLKDKGEIKISAELFMETLMQMNDADSLRPLSLQMEENNRCHLILAKNQCDWSHLAALSSISDEKNLRSLAFYYAGMDVPEEFEDLASVACAELQHWGGSFAKIGTTKNTDRQIYSILFTRKRQELDLCRFLCDMAIEERCFEIAKSWIISRDLLNDLCKCCELNDLVQRKVPPARGSKLSCPWIVCEYDVENLPVATFTSMIVGRAEYLYRKKAYERSLQIIERYRKFLDAGQNVFRDYDLTKALILKKCGYEEAARSLLSRICAAKSIADPYSSNFFELSLKARMLLAEFDMESCRPDLAVDGLQSVVKDALSSDHRNSLLTIEAHRKLAISAENKLLMLEDYCSSKTFKLKKTAVKRWENELEAIKEEKCRAARQGQVLEQVKLLEERRIQKEKMFEEMELEQYFNDRKIQFLIALDAYLVALELDENAVDIPYRILPFFIKAKYDDGLLEPLRLHLNRINSHHWLPLISHLCSHFFDDAPLATIVQKVLIKALYDYPYHVLHHLLFYTHPTNATTDSLNRIRRVESLLKDACSKNELLVTPVKDMQKAFSIYSQFAASCVKKFQRKEYARTTSSIADSLLLKKIRSLRKVPIPAINQPLTDDLSQLITFNKIDSQIIVADGLTQPIVVTVTGSDGKIRKLIFKNEDLRQDSLVEQLFSVINILLMDESKTFPLRTYHVMPINSSAGIIEFCLGTISLCNYICGSDRKSGMHKLIYPDELTAADACQKLLQARINESDLLKTYKEICANIHPVLHHFFYDRFLDPYEWRSHIQDYTISLARWSIVGYIVGLGDRHLNNIMIEIATGRLVHIDLGIVFEFGKRNLSVPERVPFRLTREMVDPILIEGVNGKFKSIAVNTLDRLRKNSQALIGLALVLLHDPLSKYPHGENGSQFATLAVYRLRDKLSGVENRIYMDPSQQVAYLIKEASDPENLARMFAGWMPFL